MIKLLKIAEKLSPIFRGITGKGVDKILKILKNEIEGLKIKRISSVSKFMIVKYHLNGILKMHMSKIDMEIKL